MAEFLTNTDMTYQLRHMTEYQYPQSVANSYNLACLTPRQLPWQRVLHTQVQVSPTPTWQQQWDDTFGNHRQFIHLQPPHQKLTVVSSSTVKISARHNLEKLSSSVKLTALSQALKNEHTKGILQAQQCRFPSKMVPYLAECRDVMQHVLPENASVMKTALAINSYIFEQFTYDPDFSSVVTPVSDVLLHKRGVCQDFAQLAISCLRTIGIPARYVSGYLETQPPAGQPRLVGADASHAWFSVFDPELGWIDFDPTNNILPDKQHITLAYGRDYSDVVPLKGQLQGSGNHLLTVEVDVIPCSPTISQ